VDSDSVRFIAKAQDGGEDDLFELANRFWHI
jgi:hypothetical protein